MNSKFYFQKENYIFNIFIPTLFIMNNFNNSSLKNVICLDIVNATEKHLKIWLLANDIYEKVTKEYLFQMIENNKNEFNESTKIGRIYLHNSFCIATSFQNNLTKLELGENLLNEIQTNLFNKAKARNQELTTTVNSYEEFKKVLDEKTGFVYAHWDGTPETEEKIKEETKATIRCIPLNNAQEAGVCIYSGKPSAQRVLFARAY